MIKIIKYSDISRDEIFYRKEDEFSVADIVTDIIENVKKNGDAALFGKKIGGDIRCNKKTFLLIKAMELAQPAQRAAMKEWMDNPACDADEKVAFFTNMYNTLGVKEVCEQRIAALFAKCDTYLENLSVPAERKAALKSFVDSLLNRNL